MMKKIVIFALCLCLLTACSDSSGTSKSSTTSNSSEASSSSEVSSTSDDKSLWKDIKYETIDGLSFPIPNGYEIAEGSGAENKNFIKLDHGKIAIKKLDSIYEINHDMLERELNKINYSVNNPVKELYSCNHIGFGILSFSAKDGNEARIFVNGSTSAFMIKLIGKFSYEDYKQFCELVKLDSTNTTTTTASTTTTSETTTTTKATTTTLSLEYQNAVKSAISWLEFDSYSRTGLIKRLEADKFPTDAATYAVDNCGADWNEQAVKSAQSWLEFDHYSKQGLIDRLIADGFTQSEAQHGADVAYK